MAQAEQSDAQSMAALRKMVSNQRVPKLPAHRAVRQSLGFVADARFSADIDVQGIEDRPMSHADAVETQMDHGAYFSTIGPNGAPGLALVSREIVAALIEIQTVGHVQQAPLDDRDPTQIDAAIVQTYLSAVLTHLSETMQDVKGDEWIVGHDVAGPIFDLHRVPLDLPDIRYRSIRATLGFGAETRTGDLVLIFPSRPIRPGATGLGRQAAAAIRSWERRLSSGVMAAPAVLCSVLHRQSFLLPDLRALEVGQMIALPMGAQFRVALEDNSGSLVAAGKLGAVNGMKAIQVTSVGQPTKSQTDHLPTDHEPPKTQSAAILAPPAETSADDPHAGESGPKTWAESASENGEHGVNPPPGTGEAEKFDDLPELNAAG